MTPFTEEELNQISDILGLVAPQQPRAEDGWFSAKEMHAAKETGVCLDTLQRRLSHQAGPDGPLEKLRWQNRTYYRMKNGRNEKA